MFCRIWRGRDGDSRLGVGLVTDYKAAVPQGFKGSGLSPGRGGDRHGNVVGGRKM